MQQSLSGEINGRSGVQEIFRHSRDPKDYYGVCKNPLWSCAAVLNTVIILGREVLSFRTTSKLEY
jgi:hypothetical protein